MDAESYQDEKTTTFINGNFIPVKAHIKEHPVWFHRFDAIWTPTVILLDSSGKERWRNEGYLPNKEFVAQLHNGLGRISFVNRNWADAERWYGDVVHRFSETAAAPEALYWRFVAQYKRTGDHTLLNKAAEELPTKYPKNIWALKTIPWAQ